MTGFILNADDYALNGGICDGILALAEARRISATSAMVNLPHWRERATGAVSLRDRLAVGLHLNLTYGAPLGPMPDFAPDGEFGPVATVIRRALSGNVKRDEVAAEIGRQLDRFEEVAGVAPDFIDGHEHVHVLPGIRGALIAELRRRFPGGGPLVRDPADSVARILRRRVAAPKAFIVAMLATGFGDRVRAAGFATNDSFAGFSDFGGRPYADEFETFPLSPGQRPMIMCHPGFADTSLGGRDPISARRPQEQSYLANRPGLPELLWRPNRTANSREFPW